MIAKSRDPWHCKYMTDEIKITIENHVGIICLNRPRAINALTPDMIMLIRETLLEWSIDSDIHLVMFEGEGEKGFCAGGDVRWTRDQVLSGNHDEAFKFFALEYEMNYLISTFAKPIVALTHGVVMGGGVGIAGHCKYRITTENSRFAMPEAAIGYFCDVGVRSLLVNGPRHRALMFMLGGTLVGAVDGVFLGLSDTVILENGFSSMRDGIIAAGSAADVDVAIVSLCARFGISYGFATFCNLADKFAKVFEGTDLGVIYTKLEREITKKSELSEIAQTILGRCPTSNVVHLAGIDAARQNREIGAVLEADLRLAHLLAVRDDLSRGCGLCLLIRITHQSGIRPTCQKLMTRQFLGPWRKK